MSSQTTVTSLQKMVMPEKLGVASVDQPIKLPYSETMTAWRNILKNRTFCLSNALALGMAAFITILIYTSFELSYDEFHTKKNYI